MATRFRCSGASAIRVGSRLTVSGIYEGNQLIRGILLDQAVVTPHLTDPGDMQVLVKTADGASATTKDKLEKALGTNPAIKVQSKQDLSDDIAKTSATNVYDAIQQLRPQWFAVAHLRATTPSDQGGVPASVIIYLDGMRYGTVDLLRELPVTGVQEVRYFDALAATNRFGTGTVPPPSRSR